jgi:hypothetical protein
LCMNTLDRWFPSSYLILILSLQMRWDNYFWGGLRILVVTFAQLAHFVVVVVVVVVVLR